MKNVNKSTVLTSTEYINRTMGVKSFNNNFKNMETKTMTAATATAVAVRALGTQTGTYSTEEKSLGSNTNLQTIFNNCHQYIFYLTVSFFLWLFGPFPGHNIPFQLGF
jgi:hypothetical protein